MNTTSTSKLYIGWGCLGQSGDDMDNEVIGKRKPVCYKIKPSIVLALAEVSKEENRSVNNTVETILLGWLSDHGYMRMNDEPNGL